MRSMQDWQNLKLILHEAIKEKKGHHEEVISILGTRSKTQLVATFNRFKDENGSSISKVPYLNLLLLSLQMPIFFELLFH